jgi:hypothetical protein
MAATTWHSINTGPYGENREICSSLKLLHWLNLNCASVIGRSFTNFVFFMLIGIPSWLQEKTHIKIGWRKKKNEILKFHPFWHLLCKKM